jgi:hypothetical protein
MKENIVEVEHCDNSSVVVVNHSGLIELIVTPFLAVCAQPIGKIILQEIVSVEQVFGTGNGKLIYQIQGKHFYHFYFHIHH